MHYYYGDAMIDELFRLSQNFIRIKNKEYIRYFLKTNPLESRFSIVVGQSGVGKTTTPATYRSLFSSAFS